MEFKGSRNQFVRHLRRKYYRKLLVKPKYDDEAAADFIEAESLFATPLSR